MSLAVDDDVIGELMFTLNRLQGVLTRQELLWTSLIVNGRGGRTSLFQPRRRGAPGDVHTLVTHISRVLTRLRDAYWRNCFTRPAPTQINVASRQPVQETVAGSCGTVRLAVC